MHWFFGLKLVFNMHYYGWFVACNVAGECKVIGLNLYDRAFLEKLLMVQLNEINCVFYRTQSVSSTKPVVSTVCQKNLIHDLDLISITVEYWREFVIIIYTGCQKIWVSFLDIVKLWDNFHILTPYRDTYIEWPCVSRTLTGLLGIQFYPCR